MTQSTQTNGRRGEGGDEGPGGWSLETEGFKIATPSALGKDGNAERENGEKRRRIFP